MRTRPTRSKNPELIRKIKRYVDEYNNRYLAMPSTDKIGKALGVTKTTVYRYLIYMNEKNIISYDGHGIVTHRIGHKQNAIDVPLSTCIPCGSTEEQEEVITDYISVPKSVLEEGDYVALKVSDDSMICADLHESDVLFVRRDVEAREEDLVVALVENGESRLGRIIKNRNRQSFLFQEANNKCNLHDSFEVQGVVVCAIKQLGHL